jgi:hypothetical protein
MKCKYTIDTSAALLFCLHNTPTITDIYESDQETSIAKITVVGGIKTKTIWVRMGNEYGRIQRSEQEGNTIHNPTLFGNYIHMPHSAIFGFSKHGFDVGVAAERNFIVVRIDPFKLDDFAGTDGST